MSDQNTQFRAEIYELVTSMIEEFGNRLVKVPGIHAITVTVVGDEDMPLGGIVFDPRHQTFETIVRGISKSSDQIDIFTKMLLSEGSVGQQDSTSLGRTGQQEDHPHADEGERDPQVADAAGEESESESEPG